MQAHFPGADGPNEDRKSAPTCSTCELRAKCYFERIIVGMIEKAQIFLDLSRNRDAEDLIQFAYRLCDLTKLDGICRRV